MTRMQVASGDRPRVKAECYRVLVQLQVIEERKRFLAAFIDSYLPLDEDEEARFEELVNEFAPQQKEGIMDIKPLWEARGEARGRLIGEQVLIVRLLKRRFASLTPRQEEVIKGLNEGQTEALGENLLDFATVDDLDSWLANLSSPVS